MAATTNFSSKVIDPSSLSNLSQVLTQHVHFNWTISFSEKKIFGHVLLDLITLVPNVSKVVLDTSYLDLKDVSLNGQSLKVSVWQMAAKSESNAFLYIVHCCWTPFESWFCLDHWAPRDIGSSRHQVPNQGRVLYYWQVYRCSILGARVSCRLNGGGEWTLLCDIDVPELMIIDKLLVRSILTCSLNVKL